MTDTAPYARAAFINAIAEEGTKVEAVQHLQETWNELCECRARLSALMATTRQDALSEAAEICDRNAAAIREAIKAHPAIKKRLVLLKRAEQCDTDAAAIRAIIAIPSEARQ